MKISSTLAFKIMGAKSPPRPILASNNDALVNH